MFEDLITKWPSSIVARESVTKFSGGVLNSKTLANKDADGTGPRERIRIGRKIAYQVDVLIEWMLENSTLLKRETKNVNKLS